MNTQANVIEALKAYALANYNNGYDTFVECYEDAEWIELLGDCDGSYKAALALMAEMAEVFSERQADAAHYQDVSDAEYTATLIANKADDDNAEDAEAAHEWECEMAAMRHFENGGASEFYHYDDHAEYGF